LTLYNNYLNVKIQFLSDLIIIVIKILKLNTVFTNEPINHAVSITQ